MSLYKGTNSIKDSLDRISLKPPLFLAIGFALLIIISGVLLSSGIFTKSGVDTPLIDSIFVAGSASCVTGLTPVNTLDHWNFLGQLIIIILIQIGGLGIMTAATILPIIMRQRIGLASRQILTEQFNMDTFSGVVIMFKYALNFTFFMEGLGAILLSIRFIPIYGVLKGIWYSIFHSISAFCNAGFDILGDSILPFKNDPLINLTIMMLIVIGGLGFMVTAELYKKRSIKGLSVHTRIVLVMTVSLILLGTFGFLLLEYNNPATIAQETFPSKVLQSSFQSIVARTAGFYSVRLSSLRESTVFLLIILMFIGGAPGSTAGGLKVTTFGVLIMSTIAVIKGEEEPVVFNKHIGAKTISKALALVIVCLGIVILVTFTLTLTENYKFIDLLYEVVSAFATVGVSRDVTENLTDIGKLIITMTMYIGRVGPLTLAYAFGSRAKCKNIRYPEANISIG